ncbi:Translocation protein 1 [Carabus blaptoides fortunei]
MAEKKKGKKRKEEYVPPGEEVVDKPSKEEYSIAKWLRKNVPIKKTKFLNHNVEYFTASKALDALMASQYGSAETPMFQSRGAAVEFLDLMLRHKFFHRARKVPVSEQELKARKKDKKPSSETDEKKKEEKVTDAESSHVEGKVETTAEKEKRKRKVRLEMHNDQMFVDGLDAYVWIYDPIPVYYWFIGTLLVLGAIGICLFPLWPPSVRKGVYYISVAAAGFLVFIIALAVLRVIVFCLMWMLTLGKHHIWLLPNLTEDVSFFASFWPLYKYEYKGATTDKKSTDKKKKKKDKDSDAENEDDVETLEKESPKHEKRKLSQQEENERQKQEKPQTETVPVTTETGGEQAGSESESESSQRSSTGRDFEMVDQDELVES